MDKKIEIRAKIEKEREYLDKLVREGAGEAEVVKQSRLMDRLIEQYYRK